MVITTAMAETDAVSATGRTSGATTRKALILAGERLFALRGFEAVSISEVNDAAEVRNRSAVYYHFKSRDGLILAVLENRFAVVNAARLAMLEEPATRSSVRDALHALIRPLAEQLTPRPEGNFYLRFLERILREAPRLTDLDPRSIAGWTLAEERLARAFPAMPAPLFRARMTLLRTVIICGLSEIEARQERHLKQRSEGHEELLIDACQAILSAAPSPEVQRFFGAAPGGG